MSYIMSYHLLKMPFHGSNKKTRVVFLFFLGFGRFFSSGHLKRSESNYNTEHRFHSILKASEIPKLKQLVSRNTF